MILNDPENMVKKENFNNMVRVRFGGDDEEPQEIVHEEYDEDEDDDEEMQMNVKKSGRIDRMSSKKSKSKS